MTPSNPYRPPTDDVYLPQPFTGRQAAYAHLYRNLTDTAQRTATVFLGWRFVGKTALLYNFDRYFDDAFLDVYVPLQQIPLANEDAWLGALAAAIDRRMRRLEGLNLTQIPLIPEDGALREWLAGNFLATCIRLLHGQYRLVLLLDDVGALLDAVADERLGVDTFLYLYDLLQQHPSLGITATLDAQREDDWAAMSPLVGPVEPFRLGNLQREDASWLLREPVATWYNVTDEAIEAICQSTGRAPRLLQGFGFHLFRRWEVKPQRNMLDVDDVRALIPAVYAQNEATFTAIWQSMAANERLVLTALNSLLYDNPLGQVQSRHIENWLVQSDYLLDRTAVNAALRGLEYRELAEVEAGGIKITNGLLQRWLLENAQLEPSFGRLGGLSMRSRLSWLLVLIVVAAIIGVVVTISRSDAPRIVTTAQPTVTLAGGE